MRTLISGGTIVTPNVLLMSLSILRKQPAICKIYLLKKLQKDQLVVWKLLYAIKWYKKGLPRIVHVQTLCSPSRSNLYKILWICIRRDNLITLRVLECYIKKTYPNFVSKIQKKDDIITKTKSNWYFYCIIAAPRKYVHCDIKWQKTFECI